MSSIRRRLLLGTVLAVALSSAVASGAAWLSVRTHLLDAAEGSLRADAAQLQLTEKAELLRQERLAAMSLAEDNVQARMALEKGAQA